MPLIKKILNLFNKNKQKTIVLIMGRSASGKDSVVRELNKKGYSNIISYATRPKRMFEGNTHIFISPDEVKNYDDIIAYTKIGDYEYFATKTQLMDNDIYIIDYYGVGDLRKRLKYDKNIKLITVYIYATQQECLDRAMKRNDSIDTYNKRVEAEATQFHALECNMDFDYCIHNTDLNKTVKIVERILEIENG